MTQYIALASIQTVVNGERVAIEPRAKGVSSGLFDADYDRKTEKRLLDTGVIRFPEDAEDREDEAVIHSLTDSRVTNGVVLEDAVEPEPVAPKAKPDSKAKDPGDAKPKVDGVADIMA